MSLVKELLDEKVNEVFLECQNRRHIECGDIEPLDAYHLELLTEVLAQHITKVLDYQTTTPSDKEVVEMLKDTHGFKKGESYVVQDSIELYYVLERVDKVLVYVPKVYCRKIGGLFNER